MQQVPIGCWDNDFLFDSGTGAGPFPVTLALESASGTNEDWDMELSLGEKTSEALPVGSEDSFLAASSMVRSTEINVIAEDGNPPPLESLLEYLDENYSRVDETYTTRALPKQPILFSAYVAYQQQRGRYEDVACIPSPGLEDCSAPLVNRPAISDTEDMDVAARPLSGSFTSISSPHAPESAQGTITWLQNLCYKVSHTSAVVARPSPEQIGNNHQRERSPSEEAWLETALRMAEMEYCNRNWRDCGVRTKNLLRQLENAAAVPPRDIALRVVAFGNVLRRAQTLDDDLRCHQCCGRLARLVCRLAQRRDELLTIDVLGVRTIKSRLGNLDNGTQFNIPPPLDAGDIAALRRGAAALVHDIRDPVLQAKSKLTFDEALAHLSLVRDSSSAEVNLVGTISKL